MSKSENNPLNLKLTPGGNRINRKNEYFTGKFPNDDLIRARILPPQTGHYTPEQAVARIEAQGRRKLKEVDKLAEFTNNKLKEQGYKDSQINSKMVHDIAAETVEKNWKADFDKQLKERYGENSREYQKFSEYKADGVKVSANSLKSWKKEAEALQRPEKHLNSIDKIISTYELERDKIATLQAGSEASRLEFEKKQNVLITHRAYKQMQNDNKDYQKLHNKIKSQSEQNQNGTVKNSSNNNTEKVQVSVNSLKSWRNEAQALQRPEKHLKAIDKAIAQGKKTKIGNKQVLEINKKAFDHMKKDKSDFKQLREGIKSQKPKSRTLRM